jgi:N-acetylglucosaminyl-diphospho-decaprenol L-rhamnosyltransferase
MHSVCLAILNYNGRKHLDYLLPTALAAAKHCPGNCTVLVLDNCSTENDAQWVRQKFSQVEIRSAPKNDFLFSYNWLLPQLKDDIIILLNNDLKLHASFLAPLIRHLESPDVFSVGACSYDWEGNKVTSGPARFVLRKGFYYWPFEYDRQELCHTLFTSGGFMAVNREKFVELGGFNRLFHPAYHEDVELCFRAWRKGWRCIYEPASVVWHREHASWNNNLSTSTSRLHSRNALLLQWACLPMNHQVWQRRWSIAKLFLGGCFRFDFQWAAGYMRTGWHWHQFKDECAWMKVSDQALDSINNEIAKPLPNLT